jgi:hypothetical protein
LYWKSRNVRMKEERLLLSERLSQRWHLIKMVEGEKIPFCTPHFNDLRVILSRYPLVAF